MFYYIRLYLSTHFTFVFCSGLNDFEPEIFVNLNSLFTRSMRCRLELITWNSCIILVKTINNLQMFFPPDLGYS